MANDVNNRNERTSDTSILGWLGRLVLTIIVLGVTSFLTPGFTISGLWSYVIAAVVIIALDYLSESLLKVDASPFGKGLKGFIIAAVILYVAQFIVPYMKVTILGAIIAALIIGVLDAIIPSRVM